VLLRIQVGVDGRVLDVEVVRSSGFERLDRAALVAVRSWRFRPGTEDGAQVIASVLHRVVFRIES
jgi:protein TonB